MSGANGTAPKKSAGSEASQESRKLPRSLEELKRLIEANPTADFELSATELMILMESPRKEFCSTPPSQQASLMDAAEPDDIRVVSCLLQHTTRGGDGTRGRCPFGRNPDGTPMKREHVGQKLALRGAKLNAAVDLAIAKKRVREDEKGRLWVCGSVPEPRVHFKGRRKGVGLCTKSSSFYLTQRLQQLAENEKTIFENRQSRLDAAEDQAIAEVTAQVREAFAPYRKQLLATIDLKPVTLKKRRHETPRKEPQLKVTLQLEFPEFDFVQTVADSSKEDFVQSPDSTSYKPENEFVQTEQPYRRESESNRVSEWEKDGANAHSPTVENPSSKTAPGNGGASLVIEYVEELFGKFTPGDPVRVEFAGLAKEFGLPEISMRRCVEEKVNEKSRKRYPVESAGALLLFIRPYMRRWIAQNGRQIESDWNREQRSRDDLEAETSPSSIQQRVEELEALLQDPLVLGHAQLLEAYTDELARLRGEQAQEAGRP